MKKMLILFILMLGLLTGCGGVSDSDYINTVKSINTNNNEKIEDLANRLLRQSEFYLLNKDSLGFEDYQMQGIFLAYQVAPNVLLEQIKRENSRLPEMKKLKWKIDGKTKKGKVVAVSTDLILIKIPTEQDGDYVSLDTKNIQIYNKKDNTKISIDTADIGMVYLDIIDRYGYKPIVKEEIIEDEPWYDEVEFYPNGRIKMVSAGGGEYHYEDKPINTSELLAILKNLNEKVKNFKVDEEGDTYYLSMEVNEMELRLEGFALSKKLTKEEKENLNDLIKIQKGIFEQAQKHWAN
ncbi:MAG: hypothetical protein ACRC8M_13590 [Cetobacterium sp.]|uniref:hypothetical protein n=1 Tax=Cetobacterium sp. TaxID=2071632 RepID=UPI003F2CD2EF